MAYKYNRDIECYRGIITRRVAGIMLKKVRRNFYNLLKNPLYRAEVEWNNMEANV